jgi:hypothetical protein
VRSVRNILSLTERHYTGNVNLEGCWNLFIADKYETMVLKTTRWVDQALTNMTVYWRPQTTLPGPAGVLARIIMGKVNLLKLAEQNYVKVPLVF